MKTIRNILIMLSLVLFGACVYGQSITWSFSLDFSESNVSDTVLQPTDIANISGWVAKCMFDVEELTDTCSVDMGGSLKELNATTHRMAFNGLASDSLPYELIKADLIMIDNGDADTSYFKELSTEPQGWGNPIPAIKVHKDTSDHTSILTGKCNFYKK